MTNKKVCLNVSICKCMAFIEIQINNDTIGYGEYFLKKKKKPIDCSNVIEKTSEK